MNKAAFLDRDGVINRKAPEGKYITRWDQMQILPGVPEAIALLNQAGYLVIVVTNQRCVAKGLITPPQLDALHTHLRDELARQGARIDGIYSCPHDYEAACNCRKPAPGMLLQAAAEKQVSLTESWMIGDSDIDIEAGKTAGCKTVKISEPDAALNPRSDARATSLLDAVRDVLAVARPNS